MSKSITALTAALVVAWALAGFATMAQAYHHHKGCNCGPAGTSTYYKTKHPEKFVTRVHDVSVVKHVTRVHHIVNVTRIQPIIHIHEVTRVHHHTIVHTANAYSSVTHYLRPIRYVEHSVQHFYDCHCGY